LDCLSKAPGACTPPCACGGQAWEAGARAAGCGCSRTNTPEQWQQRARCGSIGRLVETGGMVRHRVAGLSSACSGPGWAAAGSCLQSGAATAPEVHADQKAIALPGGDTRSAVARRLAPSRAGVGAHGPVPDLLQPAPAGLGPHSRGLRPTGAEHPPRASARRCPNIRRGAPPGPIQGGCGSARPGARPPAARASGLGTP
jgi:hypothetical protein